LGNQIALEALVRFSAEELKHQELFRRVEALIAETMVPGYGFAWDPNVVSAVVLGKSTWAVLALTRLIELFTQIHYRESIEPDVDLSTVFKDVFLYHWKEESRHAVLDELEFRRVDAGMTQEGVMPPSVNLLNSSALLTASYAVRQRRMPTTSPSGSSCSRRIDYGIYFPGRGTRASRGS
jgi:hypothetical protein